MRKYLIIAFIFASLIVTIKWQNNLIEKSRKERDTYKANMETLFDDVVFYKSKDSLNAAQVGTLTLKLEEYKKVRSKDLALIKNLKLDRRELRAITTTQTKTISSLKANLQDSIVIINDTIEKVVKCIDIKQKWFDLHGCIDNNKFTGVFINRDSLLIVETIKRKRFLGFLWKTKKIKNRKLDIVSCNPNTKIIGFNFVIIEK